MEKPELKEVEKVKGAEGFQVPLLWQIALPFSTDSSIYENWAADIANQKNSFHMLFHTHIYT